MGKGLSRAFSPIVAVAAMMAALGRSGASALQTGDIRRKAERWAHKMTHGGSRSGMIYKPNGPKECARRVAQGNIGQQYVHGKQYPGPGYPWHYSLFSGVSHHWKGKF